MSELGDIKTRAEERRGTRLPPSHSDAEAFVWVLDHLVQAEGDLDRAIALVEQAARVVVDGESQHRDIPQVCPHCAQNIDIVVRGSVIYVTAEKLAGKRAST